MAEEPVKSEVRSHVPVRVGADCGTGAGDRAGRRGALDRNTQGEEHRDSVFLPLHGHVCGLFCVSARSVHVCGPFLLPIFRWGIDSSSSFALSIWGGDRHGSQEEETHPAPLSTSAEGLAVKGVIMPRSGQTAVDREADEGRKLMSVSRRRHAP